MRYEQKAELQDSNKARMYEEKKKKTEEQALDIFKQLLNDDPKFSDQWFDCDPDFYEWCSLYDDTKHIKQKGTSE